MYQFEWDIQEIKDQQSYEKCVKEINQNGHPNSDQIYYVTLATLLYQDESNGECVAIALQAQTNRFTDVLDGEQCKPWLDAFEMDNIHEPYNTDREIEFMWSNETITFANAESLMLDLAKKLCR